ncbi:MAG: ion channel [Pseudomonadota bacterium]
MLTKLRQALETLYTGTSRGSVRFRYAMIVFDLATVCYFIVSLPFPLTPFMRALNLGIAAVIALDFLARLLISRERLRYIFQIYVISDVLVLLSLVFNPFLLIDFSFLRILRGLRLGHSEYLLQDLRRDFTAFRQNEFVFVAVLNLLVFVFVTVSAVFSLFSEIGTGLDGYINAFYFTITTLTTTGYGDILPQSNLSKVAAIVIMVVGVTLFLNLARAVFRPRKVNHECTSCGLSLHDPDAVHCKHCGAVVTIPTKGMT